MQYILQLQAQQGLMKTLPGVEQAVVCSNKSTITGYIILLLIAVIYWILKESYSL